MVERPPFFYAWDGNRQRVAAAFCDSTPRLFSRRRKTFCRFGRPRRSAVWAPFSCFFLKTHTPFFFSAVTCHVGLFVLCSFGSIVSSPSDDRRRCTCFLVRTNIAARREKKERDPRVGLVYCRGSSPFFFYRRIESIRLSSTQSRRNCRRDPYSCSSGGTPASPKTATMR